MLIAIFRYIQGYLQIRITGYSPERFLNMCRHRNIYLWGLEPKNNSYEMYISVKGFHQLKPIIRKTRMKVQIIRRIGLPFYLFKYRKRKLFFAGAILCVCMIYILSLFVWNIHIEGNFSRTDEVILEFLETKDVYHGMRKRNLDCAQIVKDIRKEFDDIIWVSASIEGTRLIIHVRENTDTFDMKADNEMAPSDIIAQKEGIIVEMITRNGVPLVKEGDTVKEGDVLVSGTVEVLNDSGEVVNYHYQSSDADILAETTLNYENDLNLTHSIKKYSSSKRNLIYFKFGSYRLTFGISHNNFEEQETETQETQLKIGEHFYLPVFYGKKTIREYESIEEEYSKEEIQRLLSEEFEKSCEVLENGGIRILEKHVQIYIQNGNAKAKGYLKVIEPIGKHIEIDFSQSPVIQ